MNPMLPSSQMVSPVLEGRYTRVRPALPADYDWMYQVAVLTSAGSRWRLHGDVPNMEQFIQFTFQGAKVTGVVEDHSRNRLGLTQIWHHDVLSRHSQITAFFAPEAEGKGWPMEGILLMADYAFRAFDLRKLYIETLETELQYYKSLAGKVMQQEGHFKGHKYVFGQFVDAYLFAIYRPDFDQFFRRVVRPARARVPVEDDHDELNEPVEITSG